MKVARIELKNFNQFKDVTLDLTYPKGHKKAGKPLDKICFIGQSGAGKTSLLRVIKLLLSRDRRMSETTTFPELDRDESVGMNLYMGNDRYFYQTYTGNRVSTIPSGPVDFQEELELHW